MSPPSRGLLLVGTFAALVLVTLLASSRSIEPSDTAYGTNAADDRGPGRTAPPVPVWPRDAHRGPGQSPFARFADDVLASFPHPARCLVDATAFVRVALAEHEAHRKGDPWTAGSPLLPAEDYKWDLSKRFRVAPLPSTFGTTAQQVERVRTLISLAVGRVLHDGKLAAEYDGLMTANRSADQAAVAAALEHAMGSAVASIVHYAFTVLQLAVDLHRPRREAVSAVTALLCANVSSLPKVGAARRGLPWLRRRLALMRLDDRAPAYEGQAPKNGRFWNALRPTLGCSSLVRLCEQPDGCRLACNFDFTIFGTEPVDGHSGDRLLLLASVVSRRQSGVKWKARQVDFVGFGSNNEFDWEESVIGTVSHAVTSVAKETLTNRIGSIVSFDCTIKQAEPTAVVREIAEPAAFGFVQYCLDKAPSRMSITMRELLPLLRSGTRPVDTSKLEDGGSVSGRNAVVQQRPDAVQWFGGGRERAPSDSFRQRSFSRLGLLKVDVEGYEFGTVPQWLRDDMAAIGRAWTGQANQTHRTFHHSADFADVDQLQFELHRMGHTAKVGFASTGSLQAHLLMLHLYALGFIPVSQERNHADNCCYEFTAVSSRFFALSEAWAVASQVSARRL